MAAILSSAGSPSGEAGLSGRATHTPTRLSRVSPHDVESLQRLDQPMFERGDVGSHVGPAALEVEHDVTDPLPGSVVGELAAASGAMDRKTGFDEVALFGARAGGVKRRMLEEPDAFGRVSARDRIGARLHLHERVGILRQSGGDDPFDGRRIMGGKQRRARGKARIEHAALYQKERSGASGDESQRPVQSSRTDLPRQVGPGSAARVASKRKITCNPLRVLGFFHSYR